MITYQVSYCEGGVWYSVGCGNKGWEILRGMLNAKGVEWLAIRLPIAQPIRIPPSCPKRFPTLQGGAVIHPDYHDYHGNNCRKSHQMDDDSPRMRRTDIVYQQCNLSPADIMRHANPKL